MTDKSLKVYVGEDRLPVHDLTSYVDWPESRFINMAYNGESAVSSIRFRDENSEFGPWVDSPITVAARNEVEILHGSNFLFRGRLIGRTWERGAQKAFKAREVVAEAEDVNVELRGLIVDQWERPAETDRSRVLALKTAYLSGNVRFGADLSTTYVSSSNTQTLPAKTYTQTDPLGVMQDIAFQTHKQFFVTIDKELFYDGYDSSAYASPLRISDDEAELRANPTTTLGIVPDSGPLFAINGQRFIDGVRLYYGAGPDQYVDVTHPGLSSAKAHWRETVYAPDSITNATEATALAETLLVERSQDGRTFTLSVMHASGGPLTEAQIGSIKPGQLIQIKARVLPLFLTNGQPNYTYYTTRIVSLQWHMPLPQQYFATLKLEKPERAFGVGTKPGPRPAGGAAPIFVAGAVTLNNVTFVTVPSGLVDAALFVAYSGRSDGGDITAVTYDPDPLNPGATYSLTKVPNSEFDNTSGGDLSHLEWWYLLAPVASTASGGSINQTGSANANPGVFLLENVDQSNPFSNFASNTGTGSASSLTLTANAAQLAIDAVHYWHNNANPTTTPTPSGTEAWATFADQGSPGAGDQELGGSYGDATPAWTFSGTTTAPSWVASGMAINGTGSIPEPVVSSGADVGTDNGLYANADHNHDHGTHTTDLHTNYVQENILTTAGDMPYATGASVWTRLAIGSSNFHLRSDGTKPVWSPESPGLTNPMTSVGDIIKGGTAGTPERLAIGGSNFILKSTGTTPEWNNTARLSYLDVEEHTPPNPPSPPASVIRIYGSNSKGFYKNSSGTVVELGGAGGGGGISGIVVKDEGSTLSTDATTLDFVGAGVTASGTGATKTITISGGGGTTSPFWWHSDNAPASPDSANREFTASLSDTRVSHGTPKGTWAVINEGAEFTQTASGLTDLDVWAIARTISVGDYVTIAYSHSRLNPLLGAFVGFSDGTTFGTSDAVGNSGHPSSGIYRVMLNDWTNFNSRLSDGTVFDHELCAPGVVVGVRVKYEAANTWGLYVRGPIGSWRAIQTNYAKTLTPTHVLFGVDMINSPALVAGAGVRIECFRVND